MAKIDKNKVKKDIKIEDESKEIISKKIDKDTAKKKTQKSGFKRWFSINWRKRWFKVTVILSIITSLFLIIFLPILFLVILKNDENKACINDPINGGNCIVPDDGLVKPATEMDKYRTKALIWLFSTKASELEAIGIKSKDALENTKERIDEQVNSEIDTYKTEHGSGWETSWNTDLENKGFDTTKEYTDSLVAKRLNSFYLSSEFKWDIETYSDKADIGQQVGNLNGLDESNTIKEILRTSSIAEDYNKDRFKSLSPRLITNVDLEKGTINESTGSSLIESFIKSYNPIATSQILFGWTWTNTNSLLSPDNVTGDGLNIEIDALEKLIQFGIRMNSTYNSAQSVPFNELATTYSTDTSASSNGNLGVISANNTGYIHEYSNAIYLAMSDTAGATKAGVDVSTNGTQSQFVANAFKYSKSINEAMKASTIFNSWGGSGSDWTTEADMGDIADFFDEESEDITGWAKTEIEKELHSQINVPGNTVMFNRKSLDSYNVNTKGYYFANEGEGPNSTSTTAPYLIVPSRYGLHMIRIEQLKDTEVGNGQVDSTGITEYNTESNLYNEIGFRMIRHDLSQINEGDNRLYNLESQYNSFVDSELENWIWELAYNSKGLDSFPQFEGIDQVELNKINEMYAFEKNIESLKNVNNLEKDLVPFFLDNKFFDGTNNQFAAKITEADSKLLSDWIIDIATNNLGMTLSSSNNLNNENKEAGGK